MSPRPPGTRRPRLLPGALFASALVVATAGGVLAATGGGGADAPVPAACAPGSAWVTVRPVVVVRSDWPTRTAPAGPTLAGCLDTSQLQPADDPRPSNPRG